MQLSGDGVFGPPYDRDEGLAVLKAAVAAGVNHIDTAQYYGHAVANTLIREALHPYPEDLAIVSKVAIRRDEAGGIEHFDEPDQLRIGIEENLTTLGVDRLAAVNLRLLDYHLAPDAKFDAQLAAMIRARDEGLIDGIGLSNIRLDHLLHAVAQTEIVCVQNLYNLTDQRSRKLLEECVARDIAFVPFFPLGIHSQLLDDPVVVATGARLGATPAQVALAWLLDCSPNILLIPGTRTRRHLAENNAAATVALDDEARDALAAQFRAGH
jgi:aryl-alcohol dehydrogenase-like predicted oxidoreductase